MSAGVT